MRALARGPLKERAGNCRQRPGTGKAGVNAGEAADSGPGYRRVLRSVPQDGFRRAACQSHAEKEPQVSAAYLDHLDLAGQERPKAMPMAMAIQSCRSQKRIVPAANGDDDGRGQPAAAQTDVARGSLPTAAHQVQPIEWQAIARIAAIILYKTPHRLFPCLPPSAFAGDHFSILLAVYVEAAKYVGDCQRMPRPPKNAPNVKVCCKMGCR